MVDVEQLVDPELEGLLRELASRPRSVFLRTSRKDAMRVLRSRTTEPVSGMAVSDALERELVTVHRAELAEILKQACRTKLLEGEREKLFMLPFTGAETQYVPAPMQALEARLERCSGTDVAGSLSSESWGSGHPVARSALTHLSILDLAGLGHRIHPSDTWRLYTAIAFNASKMSGAAREMAQAVMNGWPSPSDAARALEYLAASEMADGTPQRAVEYQEQAISILGEYPVGEVNRLRCAMIALDSKRVLDASNRLESMVTPDHPLVKQATAASMVQRQRRDWVPSTSSCRLARDLRPKLGDVAREVSRVFQ